MATIFSLVSNTATSDARVMKQARALKSQGNTVRIYGRNHADFPDREVVDGIEIVRLPVLDHTLASLDDLSILDTIESHGIFPEPFKKDLEARFRKMIQARDEFEKTKKSAEHYKEIYSVTTEQIVLLTDRKNRLQKSIAKQKRDTIATPWQTIKNIVKKLIKRKNPKELELEKTSQELSLLIKTRAEAKNLYRDREQSHPRKHWIEKLREEIFYCRHILFASQLLKIEHDIVPDVIHSHDLYPLLGAVLLGKKTGAKIIFDAHEIETERVPPLPPKRKEFIDTLERGLLDHSHHVITCCESSTEFYHQRFSKRRPVVVMNAPDYDNAPLERVVDIRKLAGLPEGTPTIVYTGGVGQEARGLDKAVLALKMLEGIHLAILGPRHPKNDQWLLEKAMEAGVSERIHFIPSVPADLVVPTIQSADVGICLIQDVSLSYRYAMPNKLFEMTFAEVPIVVSDLPEMGRFVTELKSGVVVDQTSPADIARGIRSVLDNREQYQIKEISRQTLCTKYSWKAQSEALERAYLEVLEEAYV